MSSPALYAFPPAGQEHFGFDTSKLTFQANPTTLGNPSIDSTVRGPLIFQIKNSSNIPVQILWFKWVFKSGPVGATRYNPPPGEAFTMISAFSAALGPVFQPDNVWHDTQFGLTTWLDSGDRFTGVATITEVGAMTQDLQMSATPASYASYVQKMNLAEAFKFQPNVDIPFDFTFFYGG